MPLDYSRDAWLLAQASLKYFSVKFLGLHWPEFYQEWYDLFEGHKRIHIQCARGHGKSQLISLAYPLWRIMGGKWEGVLVSYSEDQVKRLIRDIRTTVETNPRLEPLRPSTKEIWGTDMLSFPNQSELKGLGFGTSARGRHPDDIIVDDPLKDIGGMTPEDQERAFFGVIEGMAMPHTRVSVVGTPVDHGDLLQTLENPDRGYVFRKYPCYRPDGSLLFPQIWTAEALEQKKQVMGSLHFAREYLLERVDPATQLFQNQYETLYTEAPLNFYRIVTVCDPAYSEGDGDQTAIVTVGFTHGNHAYVLEAKGLRKEDPGKVVDELFRTIQTYNPAAVGIERRRGDAIAYSFREKRDRLQLWNFKYVELSHGGQSKDSQLRVGGLVPRWEARTIHLHKNQSQLLAQMYAFRIKDMGKDHDDLLDALAYCFHPDMAVPASGRSMIPEPEIRQYAKSFYAPGHSAEDDSAVSIVLGRRAA